MDGVVGSSAHNSVEQVNNRRIENFDGMSRHRLDEGAGKLAKSGPEILGPTLKAIAVGADPVQFCESGLQRSGASPSP